MRLSKIYDVTNNQLVIALPDNFKDKKQVLVIVDDNIENNMARLELLRKAASDPLFLADIKEISEDFSSIDHETL